MSIAKNAKRGACIVAKDVSVLHRRCTDTRYSNRTRSIHNYRNGMQSVCAAREKKKKITGTESGKAACSLRVRLCEFATRPTCARPSLPSLFFPPKSFFRSRESQDVPRLPSLPPICLHLRPPPALYPQLEMSGQPFSHLFIYHARVLFALLLSSSYSLTYWSILRAPSGLRSIFHLALASYHFEGSLRLPSIFLLVHSLVTPAPQHPVRFPLAHRTRSRERSARLLIIFFILFYFYSILLRARLLPPVLVRV